MNLDEIKIDKTRKVKYIVWDTIGKHVANEEEEEERSKEELEVCIFFNFFGM